MKPTKMQRLLASALAEHLGDVLTQEFLAERAAYVLEALRLDVEAWPQACLEEAQAAMSDLFTVEPEPSKPKPKKKKTAKKKRAPTPKTITPTEREQKRVYQRVRRAVDRRARGAPQEGDLACLRENAHTAHRLLEARGLDTSILEGGS